MHQQPLGLEEVEQRVAVAEDGACDEPSTGEPEHVAVPGVATCHPERADVTELGAVLIGDEDGRRSAGDITLFDSTGLAIQDLAIAKAAYAKAAGLDLRQLEL